MRCEECGVEHDGTYGTGRFCSRACQYKYIGKQSNKNGKLNEKRNLSSRKKRGRGDWACPHCGMILETRRLLMAHKKAEHSDKTIQFVVIDGKRHLIGTIWNKGLTQNTDERVKQYVTTVKAKYASGELTGVFAGKKHSEKTKQKIRESTLRYIEITGGGARYNIKACEYFDRLNKERGWNLQHAMNGGEIRAGRYSLDAYDATLNIVVEYDEHRHHYTNGSRNAKDVEREENIKKLLGCKFYRYNADDDVLIEV